MKTKMKFSKQILSVLLCLAMLISYVPMTAYAAASGACGDGVNWTLTDDGVLTISGSGVMPNYRMVAQVPYYSYRNEINEIVIESGVTAIGNLAFSGCENLKKLTIKGDINRIGARAFAQCSAITEITYCGVNAPSDLGTNIWVNGLDISVAVPENYAEGVETFANLSVSRTLPATGGEAETPTYGVKIVGHTTDTGVVVKSIISDGVAAERATHGKDLTVVLEITGEGTVDEVYVRYIEIGTDRYYFADEDCPVTLNVETLTVTIPGNLVDGTVAIDTGIMLNVIVNLEGGYLKDTNYGKRWYDADPSDDVAALSKDYAFYGYGGSWAWNDCFARDGYILKEITSNLAQHGPYDPDREVGPVLDRDMELTLVWEECTEHNYVNGTCEHCGQAQHTHNWTYTVNDAKDTIAATCTADGCTNTNGGSVKLVAPTELTYNGTAKEATFQFDNWQLGDDAKPTISYNDTDKVAVTNKDIVATITLGVESASVTYKVKPASISGATVTADTVNYTGSAQTPDVSVVLNGKTLVKDTDYTVSYNNNTNAGTATVTVTGTGNYEGTATGTFTITDTAEPTGAILIKDNTWLQFLNNITFGLFFKENVDVIVTADGTGSAVDKVEYLFSSTELNKNNLPADGWKTVEGNNGTYTFAITAQNKGAVYVKITDAYGNVAVINSDGIVVYTDSKVAEDTVYFTYQSTEDAVIDLELNGNTVKNVLFNGHEITNYWSVGGNKLTLDADYLGRLVVLDNGAGYPVTVYFNPLGVETEKVELKDEFTLVIQKADGSVTNISNIGKTYDGTSVSEPTFDKLGDGVATVEYKVKDADESTYTTDAPKNAGDYVVRVTVAEGTNHKEASATAEFTIDKVAITVTADAKSKTYGEGDPALAWNITSGALVNGEQLTGINISRVSGENANTYAITVSQVDGANKNYDITFVDGIFTINAKTLNATVVVNGAPFTYNGSKHEPEIAVKDGNTVIPANEYEVGYANNINAGTATVTITDKDGGNYVVNGTATFIINKADPVIGTVGVDGVVKDSTKPSDVVLTRTNATVNGVLTLADNAMLANKSTYRWVFTPTDTDNYNVINGDVQIDVLDTVLPTAEIKVDTNEWKHFINNITFGLFFKETQEVTIVAADNENGSGIKEILYFVSDNELEEEDLATVEWKSYAEAFNIEPDGKYVIYAKVADKDGNTVVINSDGVVVDETAAVVSGITDGETYYGQLVFTVTDELAGVKSVVIDGVDKTHFEGQYLINGDNAEHTVIVTDNAGNVTEYKVTVYKNYTVTYKADGESISTETVGHGKDANLPSVPAKDGYVGKWDGDGKNITGDTTITVVYTEIPVVKPDEVKPEDKSDLEDAKEKLEEMLEDDSYTDDDKKDIQDAIDDIDDALDIIGNVEAVEELIDKLPDTIKKDDEAAIKAADDAYNALTDYEKSLVDEDAKKALDDAKAALAELKKPADTDSPQTGDNSNMALWIALLFISGGAVITLTVVDRKRRMASKR